MGWYFSPMREHRTMTTTCAKTMIVYALQVSHFSSYAFVFYCYTCKQLLTS